MTRRSILTAIAIVLVGCRRRRREPLVQAREGADRQHRSREAYWDLEAIVSASGKIQPKRLVQISAETPGRVVQLAVDEGDRVKKGDFLLLHRPADPADAGETADRRRCAWPKPRSNNRSRRSRRLGSRWNKPSRI